MKGERQSIHLAKMMKKYQTYPEYELVLPFVKAKKSALKRLSKDDLLLLGLEVLELQLLDKDEVCAELSFHAQGNGRTLSITACIERQKTPQKSKKYAVVKCSFGSVQSREITVGHKIDVSALDLHHVDLYVKDKLIAQGTLVSVDDEIAVRIDEVLA